MDEQLKELMRQLQEQKVGQVIEQNASQNDIQEMAAMEPPRPDYSNAIKKDRFNKIKQYVGNLPNTVAVDPNYVVPVPTREVYPSQEKLSAQQQAFKSIRDAFNGDPEYRTMEEIERLRKVIGSK
jgi:hypothetical protein